MQLPPPDALGLKFVGQKAQHSFFVYHMLSTAFQEFGSKVRFIFELGTAWGAMSLYLNMWAVKLGLRFTTFDINPKHDEDLFDKLGVDFMAIDLFSEEFKRVLTKKIAGEPAFGFFDNGNKVRELQLFVPLLPPGSIVCVHDWGTEVPPASVEDVVAEQNLVPFWPEAWDHSNAMLAIWRKAEPDEH